MSEMPDAMSVEEDIPEEEIKLKEASEQRILQKMTEVTSEGCNLVGSGEFPRTPRLPCMPQVPL